MFRRRPQSLEVKVKDSATIDISQSGLPTPPKDVSPPPSYLASASPETIPDITAAFANLELAPQSLPTQKPTPDQCLAHLKLLEAFHLLREEISQHDSLFGIYDKFATTNDTELLAKIREKRWQIYVSKAAKRFEAWWKICVLPNAKRQSQHAVTLITRTPWEGTIVKFEKHNVPPLGRLLL